jgi:hypothetical protein
MKQQTALQWLLDNLITEPHSKDDFKHNKKCLNEAEKMETYQIFQAYVFGAEYGINMENGLLPLNYYNNTYLNR